MSALTEIYDDDVEDVDKSNGARQSPIVESEHAEFVYVLDEEKSHSTEQIGLLDYFESIESGEEEEVDSSNAMARSEIPPQPQEEWHLIDGENDDDEMNSVVEGQQETDPVPNKRRRSGSTGHLSEVVISSTMRQQNETTTLMNPTANYQTESITKNIAQAAAKEVTALSRTTANHIESHDEETLFALSLVGTLKRLPPQKLAAAKCHILTYLMQLEYGNMDAKFS